MKTQRGAVLIVSLVFLMLLTLLATSSMQNATLQEKAAGGLVLRDASFQLAETVLRTAETEVLMPGFSHSRCSTPVTCLPPPEALSLTAGGRGRASGVNWLASNGGFFGIQYLGETEDPAAAPDQPQPQKLYRVTAIGVQGTSRTVLESIHTGERRILWRQRR
ncbi:PilX N-terminal domain-containing pilus assembly protein [Pseudomonas sp. LP_7_YM]|uniref:pilus assembly PilX family protein n=1 Tax=Pseudomonas sp. LP_7_YM TaxID=2485137 RepID=UPI00105E369B|nr:PilX N-terminal domain-containing pilus assembly protein [Pseudomonas sp. LP_7_YM]TDV65791.1 type IV pilus assembly protein PilX [Pseudomonas sp. LP_7_YM]